MSLGFQLIKRGLVFGDDLSLGMRYRQIDLLSGLDKDTSIGLWSKIDPPIFKLAAVVVGYSKLLLLSRIVTRQDSGLDQDLEAVADSEHEFSLLDESSKRLVKVVNDLVG